MKKIQTAHTPAEANLVKGILENEGIESVVQGEHLWSIRGEIPATPETAPSVWVVNDDDYDRAMEVLSDLKQNMDQYEEGGPEWRCASCGETNESQFTACWSCGKDRLE